MTTKALKFEGKFGHVLVLYEFHSGNFFSTNKKTLLMESRNSTLSFSPKKYHL